MTILSLGILRERNSLLLFLSQSVSAICDKMMSIGLIWYLTKEISVEIIPWFLTISFLPHFIFSFYSTNIINRFGALKTVIFTDFFRGFVLFIFYLLLSFFSLSNSNFIFFLFLSMFLIGIGSSLFNPAILSLPPKVTTKENIMGLNALMDSSFAISTIIGSMFAIFLLQVFKLNQVVLINALSFFWAGILQLGVKLNNNDEGLESSKSVSPFTIIKKYSAIAKMLFLFFLINFFLNPIFVVIPWYVEKIYHGDGSSLALIEGMMGIGAFLTGIVISILKIDVNEKNRTKMISTITFIFGVLFFLFALSVMTWQGASIMFLVGVITSFLNIQVITYFQTAILEEYVPAVMTLVNLISAASLPFTFIILGITLPYIDVPLTFKILSLIVIMLSFFTTTFLGNKNEN